MTPLEDLLLERLRAAGPITFAAYMREALYHPELGYYAAGPERSGWRGDFLTSGELHPAFGELWARFFRRIWEETGRPERFEVVEVGAGEGSFAAAVLSSLDPDPAGALTFRLVEPLPVLRARQQERLRRFEQVGWSSSLDEAPVVECGCVFLNEVLDNLPVHVIESQGGALRELWVEAGAGLELVPGKLSDPALEEHLRRLGVRLPEGHRLEVCLDAAVLLAAAARLIGRGAIVVVDYGMDAAELAARPHGTLVAYSRHGVDTDVLERPGQRDVTAHVNWSWVRACLEDEGLTTVGPVSQAAALRGLGSAELDAEARAAYERAAQRGHGAEAVRALSRRQALAALAEGQGLGALGVMLGLRRLGPEVLPLERAG